MSASLTCVCKKLLWLSIRTNKANRFLPLLLFRYWALDALCLSLILRYCVIMMVHICIDYAKHNRFDGASFRVRYHDDSVKEEFAKFFGITEINKGRDIHETIAELEADDSNYIVKFSNLPSCITERTGLDNALL